MKIDINWKRDKANPVFAPMLLSIIFSLLIIFLWKALTPFGQSLYLAVAGYFLGWGVREIICKKVHDKENLNIMAKESIHKMLFEIDAERVANGLKPLSEMYEQN